EIWLVSPAAFAFLAPVASRFDLGLRGAAVRRRERRLCDPETSKDRRVGFMCTMPSAPEVLAQRKPFVNRRRIGATAAISASPRSRSAPVRPVRCPPAPYRRRRIGWLRSGRAPTPSAYE